MTTSYKEASTKSKYFIGYHFNEFEFNNIPLQVLKRREILSDEENNLPTPN